MILSKDLAGGIAATGIGSIYLYYSTQIRSSPLADSVGPAGTPKLLGILMIALGLLLCAQALYRSLHIHAPAPSQWTGDGRRVLRAAGLLLLGIAYLAVVKTLGYTLSIALLIIFTALYQGAAIGCRLPVIGAAGGLVLWLIFDRLLGIVMPSGKF